MEFVGYGDGFPDEQSARRFVERMRRRQRPDNERPVTLPLDVVLGRGEDAVVFLSGCRVYSTGVELPLTLLARRGPHGRPGSLGPVIFAHHGSTGERLLVGVQFPDGRTTTSFAGPPTPATFDQDGPDQPRLAGGGGHSGGRSAEQALFLTPLPPPGPLLVVCACAALGIPETRTELPGDEISAAAERVEELWPWQPPEAVPPVPEAPPTVPEGGWFAQHLPRPPN